MAFLDNSGDIILDAVLTDLGRKRMAEGNFRITQFALGDDEIDYALFNKSHPSGSAYYDLEILQTPVFEAFTGKNASINYGLASFNGNNELLYLPSLKLNEKLQSTDSNSKKLYNNVAYIAANTTTRDSLVAGTAIGSDTQVLKQNEMSNYFVFESGLNAGSAVRGTSDNRTNFIISNNLIDSEFVASCDGRFIGSLLGISSNSTFSFTDTESNADTSDLSISLGNKTISGQSSTVMENYNDYIISSVPNLVFYGANGNDTSYSSIDGPRAGVTAMAPVLVAGLDAAVGASTPSEYSNYGNVNQNLFGDGNTYDYIDTTVYLKGTTTGVTTQLIARIIRQR